MNLKMEKVNDIHKDLVDRCKMGDIKAQYSLFKTYNKAIYNIAMRFFNNKMDAEDIVQETFILAFTKIGKFKGDSTFGFWLKRIAINKSISELRKRKINFEMIDANNKNYIEVDEDEIDERIKPELIHEAIKGLPTGARTIINLFALEGYKHKDIARMLGISESTSKTQYKRAKKLLTGQLKKLENAN